MRPSPDRAYAFRLVLIFTAIGGAAGGVFGLFHSDPLWTGMLAGACDGAALSSLEIFVLRRSSILRWPFAAHFALRVGLYAAAVLAINGPTYSPKGPILEIDWRAMQFSLAVAVAVNLVFSVNQLLGPGVLFAFAAGRYHRPRRERRIVLYADLTGSTALAERLGEEKFLDLLNAFFHDLATAIAEVGGDIHKYVGDEAIATWPAGADPADPIRACFAARRNIEGNAGTYGAEFGATPKFRAAIHEGPVVLGELGWSKKEIALIGDAMNVAARLLEAAREQDAFTLISGPLYDRLAAPPAGIGAQRLPALTPRGKSAALEIVSLRQT